ncbi:PHA/PHB synthase family protein [Pseudonocardia humida]|uniref:Alpha/beta fold hydrolase n=1 Tax=Pseudonocardia humida TaxID=2800819 RepID=A0ABT0ZXW8_9PSEU|nr:alpha/beta fold hydrolase [Pseudonocardia humida]MCO1655566.1 alpha/beta fold hydrolase [Pseudonocardia humida]
MADMRLPFDTQDTSDTVAERAAGVLGPESDLFEDLDAAGFGEALRLALRANLTHPAAALSASVQLAADLTRIPIVSAARWVGREVEPPVALDPKDRRFADPAWTANPLYYAARLTYAAASRFARDVVGSAQLEPDVARKAAMATDLLIDAAAPTNLLPLNPAALKRAFDTGGASLVKGARNFVDDLVNNGGRPRQVDASGFEVGGNLAVTPAKVVYRNELMELLQYEPQTEQVHAVPVLCSPPWINKYYIMDLAPGRSFIEWAVRQGRTVFAISYLNPSKEMAGTTMDDYLVHGPRTALDVITDITGAETVDIVGLCLGGALTAITAAYLTQAGDDRVGAVTLINTMLDYAEPGALGTFTDTRTVERLERKMAKEGTLAGASMAGTFDVLRANDLIFNYVVSNWLMGQDPPAFDILAWNADSTRMPAAMHAFYLRNFYIDNKLAAGTLEIGGATIDLSAIKVPVYVVSAINDHIVPWESAYRSVGLVSGPTRFVLGNGGHIAGIVSPPGPKAWHMVVAGSGEGDGAVGPATAKAWREVAERRSGSWWEDWTSWSQAHAGPKRKPPRTGSAEYPVLGDGPGRYVHS